MDNKKKIEVSKIMIFALNVCLLYIVGMSFFSRLFYDTGLDKPWRDLIAEGIALVLTAIMAVIQRKDLPSYGICRGSYKGSLKYIIPLSILALVLTPYLFIFPVTDPAMPAIFDILYIGIMEELIFRGLIFHATKIITDEHKALFISSILFGLTHLLNLSGGYSWEYVVLQVASNIVIGLGLAALRVKTKSILAGIIIHFFLDLNILFADRIPWVQTLQIIMYCFIGILLYIFYLKDRAKEQTSNKTI